MRYLHWINVLVIITLVAGAGYLTYEAIDHDNYHTRHPQPPAAKEMLVLHQERTKAAINFHEAREQAEQEYQRIKQLVDFYGIPKEGAAVSLVRNDPEVQGPRIFRRNCASCHSFVDAAGKGIRGPARPDGKDGQPDANAPPFGAPNLHGFATRDWFRRILDPKHIVSDEGFGATRHKAGEMASFVTTELAELSTEQQQQRDRIIAAVSAEAALPEQREQDGQAAQDGSLELGRAAVAKAMKDQACTDCHKFRDAGELGAAPDLTGYGSRDWLRAFLANPKHERFYGEKGNDRMPSFAPHADDPRQNLLSDHDLDMLVRWLRGEDRELTVEAPKAESGRPAPERVK